MNLLLQRCLAGLVLGKMAAFGGRGAEWEVQPLMQLQYGWRLIMVDPCTRKAEGTQKETKEDKERAAKP